MNVKTSKTGSIARGLGIVLSLGWMAWGAANWRSSILESGWHRLAVLAALVFGPGCLAHLVASWLRARKRMHAPAHRDDG